MIEVPESLRMERTRERLEGDGGDVIFNCLRCGRAHSPFCLEPFVMSLSIGKGEETSVDEFLHWQILPIGRVKNLCMRVEISDDSFDVSSSLSRHSIALVQDDHISKLDLINEEMRECSLLYWDACIAISCGCG